MNIVGALPNVMFLIGMMAIGIGLGLEFKIVEIKGQLSRRARFGAIGVGALLIGLSTLLYLKPDVLSPQTAGLTTPAADAAAAPTHVELTGTDAVREETQMLTPTSAPVGTGAPAQAVEAPVQTVSVPDIEGQSTKDVERLLAAAGLVSGQQQSDCAALGTPATEAPKGKVSCQRPAPGTRVASGTPIEYVLAQKGKD